MEYTVKGKIWSNGHYYVAGIPSIKIFSHGRSAFQSLNSLKTMVETMVGLKDFQCQFLIEDNGVFTLRGNRAEIFQQFLAGR